MESQSILAGEGPMDKMSMISSRLLKQDKVCFQRRTCSPYCLACSEVLLVGSGYRRDCSSSSTIYLCFICSSCVIHQNSHQQIFIINDIRNNHISGLAMASQYKLVQCLPLLIILEGLFPYYLCSQSNIINTTQFHFIPALSYLEFTILTASIQSGSQGLSINAFIQFVVLNPSPSNTSYNIIFFPSDDQASARFYDCYMRAALEGFSNNTCGFTISNTSCDKCVNQSIQSINVGVCRGCGGSTNLSMNFNESLMQNQNKYEKIMAIVIDNTNVVSQTGQDLQIDMTYNINMTMESNKISTYILFITLQSILILIVLIVSACVIYRTKLLKDKIQTLTLKSNKQELPQENQQQSK